MQFKHPEILYFLALLIIPIIVHLFQLQKFVKTPFTNVAFLKKISLETRKSSRLKKWLILATRILLFSAIIFAFSQPFFSKNSLQKKQHISIYLDNSLSMNSKGIKDNLFEVAKQEVIENISNNQQYSLLTNDAIFKNISANELKKALLKLTISSKKKSIKDILLKLKTKKNTKRNTSSKIILISDFQNTEISNFTDVNDLILLINPKISHKNNIFIDTLFVSNKNEDKVTLKLKIKNNGDKKERIPIAIFNNEKLLSKQTISLEENELKTVSFSFQNKAEFVGKIQLNFQDIFPFDNACYFTIKSNTKNPILSIGKPSEYLSKIFTKKDFFYTAISLKKLNYNAIEKQQLIILNELEKIPNSLQKSLQSFSKKGGHLIIIPHQKIDISSYQLLFNNLQLGKIHPKVNDSLKITNIHYNHPIFKNVFSKKTQNFQYPFVSNYYPTTLNNNSDIISFENNTGFISQITKKTHNIYWFASPLSKKNSNFTNSPLIVPVFYKIGQESFQLPKLYYRINERNQINIKTPLKKDEVVRVSGKNHHFIPLQKAQQKQLQITLTDQPLTAGNYFVIREKDTLQSLAFNYPKQESSFNFLDVPALLKSKKNITSATSIKKVLQEIQQKNKVQWLWKWFLTLAIVSLLVEIFILKFFTS